ncbi:MAG TPA: hypothetical protein VLD85_02135 [Anaeromyxobacteraceae bacterium]|nr:hypothetical protein [Anaeromyxobacteraceae bacterium]
MATPATCRVKGCERPPFVGGLCGLHALQGFYRSARRGAAPARPRPPPA